MEADEVELVYRAQGSVGMLDLILGLEDDLKEYERLVREGKAKLLKETPNALVR